jgi:hypothetical protein
MATMAELLLSKKMVEKRKWKKTSSCLGDKTSKEEKALSMPLKPSKKFSIAKSGA